MIIIAASPDININAFITQTRQSSCDFEVKSFNCWQKAIPPQKPTGFAYLRVNPEITLKRMLKHIPEITYEQILKTHTNNENYFINKTTIADEFKDIPVLILNGTIDWETDFSQFYTHLFSIKKFFKEIQDQENKRNGTYVAPKKHTGCKC